MKPISQTNLFNHFRVLALIPASHHGPTPKNEPPQGAFASLGCTTPQVDGKKRRVCLWLSDLIYKFYCQSFRICQVVFRLITRGKNGTTNLGECQRPTHQGSRMRGRNSCRESDKILPQLINCPWECQAHEIPSATMLQSLMIQVLITKR